MYSKGAAPACNEQSRITYHVHVHVLRPFVIQVTQIYKVLGYVTQQFVDLIYAIYERSRKLTLANLKNNENCHREETNAKKAASGQNLLCNSVVYSAYMYARLIHSMDQTNTTNITSCTKIKCKTNVIIIIMIINFYIALNTNVSKRFTNMQ